jgi:hypothetical protein
MEARMSSVLWVLISAGLVAGQTIHRLPGMVMATPEDSSCPPMGQLDKIKTLLSGKISDILSVTKFACPGSGWKRVAYLNMRDPNQTCPEQWRLYEQDSVRACGRQETNGGTCDSVLFSTGGYSYTQVCGRIAGYQYASPDTSTGVHTGDPERAINGAYLDGVSLTHGEPREHIWSFYGAIDPHRCCWDGHTDTRLILGFVGNNSFCDSGNPYNAPWGGSFFTNHPLWDGEANCIPSPTCCAVHTGPWFHTELDDLSIDDVEVRICGDQPTHDEDTPVELIEIYVK